jgi:hypothetical protein
LATSQKSWAIRREAVLGTGGRLAYTEMTAETVQVVNGRALFTAPDDPLDPDVWYRCMPGLGIWVTEESVEDLRQDLHDLFPREGLCVWDPDPFAEGSTFPDEAWARCCDEDLVPKGRLAFGVDSTPERSSAAIVACDAFGRIEVVDTRSGLGWVTAKVIDLAHKHNATVGVDTASPAHSLADEWERQGVTVQRLSSREMAGASGTFYDAVLNHTIQIRTDKALDRAAAGARRRESGDVWYWARRDNTVDVSPLVAASIARWVAVSTETPTPAGVVLLSDYLDEEN